MELVWKKLAEEPYKAGYRRLIKRKFQFPNGQVEDFDLYHDGNVATAMALTPDRQVITAKHFRPGPEKVFNELISGFINPNEDPIEAMHRELLEETGYQGDIKPIGSCYFSAYSTGQKFIYLIENCHKTQDPHLDQAEYLEIELLDLDIFRNKALAGNTTDLDAILLILRHLEGTSGSK